MKHPDKISEIYITDEKLNLLTTIRDFKKLEWKENLFEADVFDIETKYKKAKDTAKEDYSYYKSIYDALFGSIAEKTKDFDIIPESRFYPRYVFTDSDDGITNIAVIETFSISDDSKLKIKGRGLISIFERKFLKEVEYKNEKADKILCDIIKQNNFLDFLITEETQKAEVINTHTKSSDSVYKKLKEVSKTYGVGMSSYIDFENKKVIFKTIYKDKNDIKTAVSKDEDNLVSYDYEADAGNICNYCIIEGNNVTVAVDIRKDKENEPVLECRKKSNLKKETSTTDEEYKKLLEGEGREYLSSKKLKESFDIEVKEGLNIEIGDFVLCKIDLGYRELLKELQVTSISHTVEKNRYKRKVGFGELFDPANELKIKLM